VHAAISGEKIETLHLCGGRLLVEYRFFHGYSRLAANPGIQPEYNEDSATRLL
jgi:hypothetical protein